ncbi:ABC transporter substrate-binding protein [Cryobacterium lactosi]|uniref:ABC transporter substrate-binding protein n=1 Tax=Cryobacterium lactosi TaxID=1259202 RepID=A0A4R9BGJ4_9MICO|nr:ABC transporter substrate-binding protein [Cryobacterium lactosi]TFD83996.1 ABC transporter substrate-binding protein [Cryobacterium lactosi]
MHRKALFFAATAATAALVLSGCTATQPKSADGDPVTITFWNSYTGPDRTVVEKIVEDFNESQDDVSVDMTIQPFDVYSQKLLPAMSAGEGPTIAALDASQFPQYAELGVISPIDDFYDSGAIDPDTLPQASLDATTLDGEIYGSPMIATNTMLYWNKDLFAAAGIDGPPATMEEMAEDAVALTKYQEGAETTNTYGIAIPDREATSSWGVLLWADGGGFVSDDKTESIFASKESVATMTKWNDLIQKQHISPVGLNGVDGDSLFGAGRAAMLMNGPWASAAFEEAGINFGVAPTPEGSDGQFAAAVSSNMHLAADATDAERQGTYDFFAFWNSKEASTYYAVETGFPPTRTDVTVEDLAANPTSQAFQDSGNGKFYLGGLTQYANIDSNIVVPTLQRVTNNEGTVEDLLKDASDQINSELAQ